MAKGIKAILAEFLRRLTAMLESGKIRLKNCSYSDESGGGIIRQFSSGSGTTYDIVSLLEKLVSLGAIEKGRAIFRVAQFSWAYANNGKLTTPLGNFMLAGAHIVFMGCYSKDPTLKEENGNYFDLILFLNPSGNQYSNAQILKYTARSGSQYENRWVRIKTETS